MSVTHLITPITPNGIVNKVNELTTAINSSKEPLMVFFTFDDGEIYSDKTYAQINSAMSEGRYIFATDGSNYYNFVQYNIEEESFIFTQVNFPYASPDNRVREYIIKFGDLRIIGSERVSDSPSSSSSTIKIFTATCTTAASTAAKVATLDDSTGFSLTAGTVVAVTFQYGNSATTPTLNVGGTGAKTVAIPSSATAFTTGSGTTYNTWGARETIIFTYTGTYWSHTPSGRLGYLAYNGLSSKANTASPSLTGTPIAPTAAAGTNTTQIATTAFVQTAVTNATSEIGTVVQENIDTTNVSLNTSTYTSFLSAELSPGVWLLIGRFQFSSNATGVRRLGFSQVENEAVWEVSYPAGSAQVKIETTKIVNLTNTTTYYLTAWQNSGATLTGVPSIQAVKIK